ncbi:MAG TPA: Sapep family Mn(2+)-dependent dipeptidase [Sumerlaeia bacterium]|nr:Sapep family Mn(2+)-dependent dipeptidase [Sumerlaeia bacterium]
MSSKFDEYYLLMEQLIHDSQAEMVEKLASLLMFHTVSGSDDPDEQRLFRNELSRAFSVLSGLARQMGFECRNYDSRVLVIEEPGGPEVVGLPLHIDVVPSGEGWNYPAFGGMVENGTIYGRGAQDDKGPIIQMLYALHTVKRLGVPFRRTVRLIIASQEETGEWSDVEEYLRKEPAPHMCIVADSDFPIVNGEKGMVDLKIEIRWPDDLDSGACPLKFHSLTGGERSNIVPNRGDIAFEVGRGQARGVSETLTRCVEAFLKTHPTADTFPVRMDTDPERETRRVHVTFLGKSAHGSTPEKGHNALIDALQYLPALPELPEPLARAAEFLGRSCEPHDGSGLGIAAEHEYLGKTTGSLGILKMDKRGATAIVNVRPTYGQTSDMVLEKARAAVAAWANDAGLEADVSFNNAPKEPLYVDPKKHPDLIQSLQRAFSRVTHDPAALRTMGGTTFAKAFRNAVSFGPVYPAQEKNLAHQADECLPIRHLVRNVKIYGAALILLAADLEKASGPLKLAGQGLGL